MSRQNAVCQLYRWVRLNVPERQPLPRDARVASATNVTDNFAIT